MGSAGRNPHGRGKRLIADERLRTELELCDRWGIPHSQFLGSSDGRWSPRDREKALAFHAWQRSVCPQCGTRYEDWDHGGDDEEDAYVASVQRCVGCQVIGEKQDEIKDQPDPHGKKIALLPVAVHAAMQAERELKRQQRRQRND
ncbi:hypothetical protein [Streptomyces sp. NPDC005407]|uniref:hypothetical protein n=1 Tax=Streptomyces sp. NPDC005407 TaxID=3155340 RepID=UPI0033AD3EE4